MFLPVDEDTQSGPEWSENVQEHAVVIVHGVIVLVLVFFELFVVQMRKHIPILSGIWGNLIIVLPVIPLFATIIIGFLALDDDLHGLGDEITDHGFACSPTEEAPTQNCECWVGADEHNDLTCNFADTKKLSLKYFFVLVSHSKI